MKELKKIIFRMIALIPGAVWLKRKLLGDWLSAERLPVSRPFSRGAPPRISVAELRKEYQESPAAGMPDSFVLYRIIGNDLYPRHRKGQCRENLQFILENEPDFEDCEKRFVVNRIVDPDEEQQIITLLENAGMPYIRIPFQWEDYAKLRWDIAGVPARYAPCTEAFAELREAHRDRVITRLYRHKNNYVMNNNGARNAALREGKALAKWVLPWDGNCFLTADAWEQIRDSVKRHPEVPYHIVPMARIVENSSLLDPDFRPPAEEEPQVLFRCDTREEFNPDYPYGRRPKVELLWRLGVHGVWDDWYIEPWDLPCPDYAPDAGKWRHSGWVARLFSGRPQLESGDTSLNDRGLARIEAIVAVLDSLDARVLKPRLDTAQPVFLAAESGQANEPLRSKLREAADAALTRGPYSVVHKTTLPPSGNPHDYWHPAPYYWPNPLPIPGLPYVRRDGQRAPGTRMYEPLSDQYDRTRLQRLFDDTFVLALACREFDESRYAEHAAKLVRCWFLDPATAMNPHLDYAQVRIGRDRNKGGGSGVIELKDLYYFLDAVRLLQSRGVLSVDEQERLREWFRQYLQWLLEDEQASSERRRRNNHGTYYDLQVAAIAAWLGDVPVLCNAVRDSMHRMLQQFSSDGQQPEELARTATAHYCCFNLQGWIHLAILAERTCDMDLWSFEDGEGRGLEQAMHWLLQHMEGEWPYPQVDEFDRERFYPILHACREKYGPPPGLEMPPVDEVKAVFHPHDGIRPFWQLV